MPPNRYYLSVPKTSGKMSDWEQEICARVKTVQESIGWSQAAFAAVLGITRDQLAGIEYGRTPLRYDIAWRLRHAFGISLRWLEEGFGFADGFPGDFLPIPTATGLPPRALLSTVVRTFSGTGHYEKLLAVGPKATTMAKKSPLPAAESTALEKPSEPEESLEAIRRLARGQEGISGTTDAVHRQTHEMFLKGMVEEWIASVPLGEVEGFSDDLVNAARKLLQQFPPVSPEEIDRRSEEIMWERIRFANARKVLVAAGTENKLLTEVTSERNLAGMTEIAFLLQRLKRALEGVKKGDLARSLKVPLPRVSEWLSGRVMPSGETALRLLHWVEQREQKPNAPSGAINTTKGKATRRKVVHEKKPTSSHKQE